MYTYKEEMNDLHLPSFPCYKCYSFSASYTRRVAAIHLTVHQMHQSCSSVWNPCWLQWETFLEDVHHMNSDYMCFSYDIVVCQGCLVDKVVVSQSVAGQKHHCPHHLSEAS